MLTLQKGLSAMCCVQVFDVLLTAGCEVVYTR